MLITLWKPTDVRVNFFFGISDNLLKRTNSSITQRHIQGGKLILREAGEGHVKVNLHLSRCIPTTQGIHGQTTIGFIVGHQETALQPMSRLKFMSFLRSPPTFDTSLQTHILKRDQYQSTKHEFWCLTCILCSHKIVVIASTLLSYYWRTLAARMVMYRVGKNYLLEKLNRFFFISNILVLLKA